MHFSIIVPVFNRPEELDELIDSLSRQTFRDFEIIVIDDGSTRDCKKICESWKDQLDIHYIYKANSGQGFSRNVGFEKAVGDYFIMLDSDCLVPATYLATIRDHISKHDTDAWGGPDQAHPEFTAVQKAINYAMTSPLSTGGIRGGEKQVGHFLPRSFNMGISREVFEKTGGFRITRKGEDIDLSLRIIEAGFRVDLISDAYVYHKRRSNLFQFFRQLHFFGKARVHTERLHPTEKNLFHLLPTLFLFWFIGTVINLVAAPVDGQLMSIPLILYFTLLFLHALQKEKNIFIALLSMIAVMIQLSAYGIGYLQELIHPHNEPFKDDKF